MGDLGAWGQAAGGLEGQKYRRAGGGFEQGGHRISLDSGGVIWQSGFRQAIDYRDGSVGHRGLEKTTPVSPENVTKTKLVERVTVTLLRTS